MILDKLENKNMNVKRIALYIFDTKKDKFDKTLFFLIKSDKNRNNYQKNGFTKINI